MTCSTPCRAHTHQQGDGCLCDTNASRAALGMRPLSDEEADKPLYELEDLFVPIPGWLKWLCCVAVCICAAIAFGAADPLFPRM